MLYMDKQIRNKLLDFRFRLQIMIGQANQSGEAELAILLERAVKYIDGLLEEK